MARRVLNYCVLFLVAVCWPTEGGGIPTSAPGSTPAPSQILIIFSRETAVTSNYSSDSTTISPDPGGKPNRGGLSVLSYVAISVSALILLMLFLFLYGTRPRKRRGSLPPRDEEAEAPPCDSRLAITFEEDNDTSTDAGQNVAYNDDLPPSYDEAVHFPSINCERTAENEQNDSASVNETPSANDTMSVNETLSVNDTVSVNDIGHQTIQRQRTI